MISLQWRHIERAMVSQITDISIICSIVGSGADQRKHKSSAPLAFVRRIHRWPVNSPHKRPVTRKIFPYDDVIMKYTIIWLLLEMNLSSDTKNARNGLGWVMLQTAWSHDATEWNKEPAIKNPPITKEWAGFRPRDLSRLQMYYARCMLCNTVIFRLNHNQVSMVVADVLAPFWHQVICKNHWQIGAYQECYSVMITICPGI